MNFSCEYCGQKFNDKSNRHRHQRKSCPKKPYPEPEIEITKTDTTTTTHTQKITIKLKNINPNKSNVDNISLSMNNTKQAETSDINLNSGTISVLLKELSEVKKELQELKQQSNVTIINTINNTVVNQYNIFDQKMVDIFNEMVKLHGQEYAVQYVRNLTKNKNKHNKHSWVKNSELINPSEFVKVVKYIGNEIDGTPQFELLIDNDKVMIDDGTKIDRVLTDIVANGLIKAQNHINDLADRAYVPDSETYPWDILFNSQIFEKRNKTIHDDYEKFKQIKPDSKHLIDITTLDNKTKLPVRLKK